MEEKDLIMFVDWYLKDYESDSTEWPKTEKIVKDYFKHKGETVVECPRCGNTHVCKNVKK